jgi:hypothetical protein
MRAPIHSAAGSRPRLGALRRAGAVALGGMLIAVATVLGPAASSAQATAQAPQHQEPSIRGAFRWLKPDAVPPSWRHRALPSGTGVLSYPAQFRSIPGDAGSVSVVLLGHDEGSVPYRAYLNATPRQGGERLQGWPAFRVGLLREDDADSAHEEAGVEGVAFGGSRRSCVIDDYTTRVGHHRYREIACLVQGQEGESVVVAAAPSTAWASVHSLLEHAVADYRVG